MKMLLKQVAVATYRKLPFLAPLYRPIRNRVLLANLQRQARASRRNGTPLHVVVGANHKFQPGWVGLERYTLDVTRPEDWQRSFEPGTLDTVLAEHVWEHLTPEDAKTATALCFQYLKPGGRMRLAVPDGFFPDPDYVEFVRPGGSGPGAWDHHVLYTEPTLRQLLANTGFQVSALEHYDEGGSFQFNEWSLEEGYIRRSCRIYRDYQFGGKDYTSLILDGIKPANGTRESP